MLLAGESQTPEVTDIAGVQFVSRYGRPLTNVEILAEGRLLI